MLDESKSDYFEHYNLVDGALKEYGRSWSQVISVTGDHARVNSKMALHANVAFLGCFAHRLNLAISNMVAMLSPRDYCIRFELM